MNKEINCKFDEKNNLIERVDNYFKTTFLYNDLNLLEEVKTIKNFDEKDEFLLRYAYYEYNEDKKVISEETNNYIKKYEYLHDDKNNISTTLISMEYKNIDKEKLDIITKYNQDGLIIYHQHKHKIQHYEYNENNKVIKIVESRKIKNQNNDLITDIYNIINYEYDKNNYLIKETKKNHNADTEILYNYKNDYKEKYVKTTMIEHSEPRLVIDFEVFKYNDDKKLLEYYLNDELIEKYIYNDKNLLEYHYDLNIELNKKYFYDEFNNKILEHDLISDIQTKFEYDSHNKLIKEENEFGIKIYNNEYETIDKDIINYFEFN